MKVGVAQIRLSRSVQENTDKILAVLRQAKDEGVQIINLPETAISGFAITDKQFEKFSEKETATALSKIKDSANALDICTLVGTPTWKHQRLYNSVAVIIPGQDIQLYHKMHLVSYEEKYYEAGTTPYVFDYQDVRMGVIICRDQNFPDLTGTLKAKGARCIFQSSAHYYNISESKMKLEKNVALPIVRAYENQLYMCKSNTVGFLGGLVSYGNSMIVDSRGNVLQRGDSEREELLAWEIDFSEPNPTWETEMVNAFPNGNSKGLQIR